MVISHEEVLSRVRRLLPTSDGFEVFPFRLSSYNASVGPEFQLTGMDGSSMGVLILSTPAMFDVSFRRWIALKAQEFGSFDVLKEKVLNPISEFMNDRLEEIGEDLPADLLYDVVHDHTFLPNRRPKILMCTCGHVAGAAYYYRSIDFIDKEFSGWNPAPADPDLKFIGLSLHPRCGGHFAFRSVLLFPTIHLADEFVEPKPAPVLTDVEEVRKSLELFNYSWKNSAFRDCGNPSERYSKTQMEYFGKAPADRWEVIRHWVETEKEVEGGCVEVSECQSVVKSASTHEISVRV